MVSAFSAANQVVLGQVKTSEKSNEITAIPELLELLTIRGCLITLDAMGCQRDIARKIVEKDGDYLLSVKGNQKRLQEAIAAELNVGVLNSYEGDKYSIQEKNRSRIETRAALVCEDMSILGDVEYEWSNIQTVGMVAAIRQTGEENGDSLSIRYYISSAKLSAQELLEKSRAHWSVEVQLHWRLDVELNEDACQINRGQAGENLATARHIAFNLLNAEKTFKGGMKRKQQKASRNREYLTRVLMGQGAS